VKVLVHVDYPSGIETSKRKTEHLGEKEVIVMRKLSAFKRDQDEWHFELPEGSVMPEHRRFRSTLFHVYVKPEAEKAIVLKKELKPDDIPVWDKKQSFRFINRKLLERRGEEPKEAKTSVVMWVIAIMVIVNIIATVVLSGRVRIG
jgi:hypothetical protein